MNTPKLTLAILSEKLGICAFGPHSPIPDWAQKDSAFTSITRTKDELSIVCPQDNIPANVMAEKDWRAFKLETVLDLSVTGIVSSLANPLAEAGISIFDVSTYKTNYLLVEEKNLDQAIKILSQFCEIRLS
jgi:hypothetical protein